MYNRTLKDVIIFKTKTTFLIILRQYIKNRIHEKAYARSLLRIYEYVFVLNAFLI